MSPDPLTPPSQRHFALTRLRSEIVGGRLRPGTRLVEADLADALGTSRAPVREALRQLEQEGLVASRPYAGAVVIGVDQREIENVLVPIRLTIERFAFAAALDALSPHDFDRLEQLVGTMREAGERGDADALADADVRFHELVLERSGQPHCLQIWRTIEPRVRAHFRRDASGHRDPNDVTEEHRELLDALRSRDERKTLAVLDRHIRNYLRAPGDAGTTG